VVPVEEPSAPKDVQDLEDGGTIVDDLQEGRGDGLSCRGGKVGLHYLLEGRGECVK